MGSQVKINKGLDVSITGEPEQVVGVSKAVEHVALVGRDYPGVRPKIRVEVGQSVSLGEPLFFDKNDPDVQFVAPGTGRVVAINRGRRRTFQSVIVQLDNTSKSEVFFDAGVRGALAIRKLLQHSGLWTSFRTRPYDRIPKSSSSPQAIFVTAIDTRPLAGDPAVVIDRREFEFERGLEVIRQLGKWPVYLCVGPGWAGAEPEGVQLFEFDGPHPAGLVGTHIHRLHPVSAAQEVWHIGYQDVIAIGHLFSTGRLLTERLVSIAGPGALRPRLLVTRSGASIEQITKTEMPPDGSYRLISGSVLDGHEAVGPAGYLGRYDNQISIVPDKTHRRASGWLAKVSDVIGVVSVFSVLRPGRRARRYTTTLNGRYSAFVPISAFERIMPLDILPVPLLKALLVKDTDVAQALGCLELAEEDLALCSFVCPAKLDYGAALRVNLDLIIKEG